MALTVRHLVGALAVVAIAGFAPSVIFWRSNQTLIKTATRLQTARLYDALKNEGVESPKIKTFVASKIIEQLRQAEKQYGRVQNYDIVGESVQMAGTPSFARVRCTRERGTTNDECYVHAIEPKALIWMWGTSEATN